MLQRTVLRRLGFYKRAVGLIPHPDKVARGGEDSFLICDHALGVADGVGEHFASSGVDAGEFARALTRGGYEWAEDAMMEHREELDAKEMLQSAAEQATGIPGSSTATFATVFRNTLEVAQLGDSGLLIIRDGTIIYRTRDMQHSLNYPFQLNGDPAKSRTSAKDAEKVLIQCFPGDVVIACSDGVFDNVYDVQIEQLFYHAVEGKEFPSDLVSLIPLSVIEGLGYEQLSCEYPLSYVKEHEHEHSHHGKTAQSSSSGSSHNVFSFPQSGSDTSSGSTSDSDFDQAAAGGSDGSAASSSPAINPSASHRETIEYPSVTEKQNSFRDAMRSLSVHQLGRAVDFLLKASTANAGLKDSVTPFAQRCTEEGIHYSGGKQDDATVVIAVVGTKADLEKASGERTPDFSTAPPDPYWGYPYDPSAENHTPNTTSFRSPPLPTLGTSSRSQGPSYDFVWDATYRSTSSTSTA